MPLTELSLDQARDRVAANKDIVDTSFCRLDALRRAEPEEPSFSLGAQATELIYANRLSNLSAPEFKGVFGVPLNSTNLDRSLKQALQKPESRTKLLSAIDKRVQNSSDINTATSDILAATGQRLRKDVVIIGGGPLTSMAASILGAYYDITVVTDQETIGEPWRSRPIYINSSAEERAYAPRLPLLEGTTTPIVSREQLGRASAADLLESSSLEVDCQDGSKRRYVSGMALGAVVATNIASDVEDYIVKHTFVPEKTKINPDGTKTITLVGKDGKTREIDGNMLFVLTGPGQDGSNSKDQASKKASQDSKKQLKDSIYAVKKQIDNLKAQLKQNIPTSQKRKLARELGNIRVELPKILTLSGIEDLYRLWDAHMNRDAKRFPLAPLFQPGVTVGVVGGRDSAFCLASLLQGEAPAEAYPANFTMPYNSPRIELFNAPVKDFKYLEERVRRRNRGVVVGPKARLVRLNQEKVNSFGVEDTLHGPKVGVYYPGTGLRTAYQTFDYIFDATGLTRPAIEQQFPFEVGKLSDAQGNTVALGNKEHGVVIAGSAAGLKKEDLPKQLQNIIDALGISENTISLWVHNNLLERACWEMLGTVPINKAKRARLRAAAQKAGQSDEISSGLFPSIFLPFSYEQTSMSDGIYSGIYPEPRATKYQGFLQAIQNDEEKASQRYVGFRNENREASLKIMLAMMAKAGFVAKDTKDTDEKTPKSGKSRKAESLKPLLVGGTIGTIGSGSLRTYLPSLL